MKATSQVRCKPRALRPGDTVAVVAPASDIERPQLEAGCAALEKRGYKTVFLDSILQRDLYFAGTVERRARELEEMLSRQDVRAVICARGGYGANYLPPVLDVGKLTAQRKIFCGYSDITTLQTWLGDRGNLVTFHGPMVTKDWVLDGGVDWASWDAAMGGAAAWEIADSGGRALVEGTAEGVSYGGCLSMLAASLGTPYEVETAGTILFLEDVNAKPFQIDRMLMQLKLAGKFKDVRGIVFGEMLDCVQHVQQPYTLEEVVLRVVGDLGVPVGFGLRSGHVSRANITLPLGIRAALDTRGGEFHLRFLEPATIV
jgi:muramoyltetrapeptide carboxypeptidase